MITLNTQLQKIMASQNLAGLRPFAYLYRNKWDSVNNKYTLENTAIDISSMIVKPNTLSMTLDVNEIAQFNANNITLTLTDYENKFIEGTPNSFFPSGYQLYGSRVVLYYGTSTADMTSLFVGAIKDLPTHKPEQYQVDLKLISPLQLLDDIEAKDFSDKYTGETLSYVKDDEDGHKVYETSGVGVGGFSAVYANGTKLFEDIDYEVSQLSVLGSPANVIIIKSDYYSSTITADYYCWKTGLSVEQIVSGLVALGGYTSNTDIRSVVWNTAVKNIVNFNGIIGFGFKINQGVYQGYYNYSNSSYGLFLPSNFKIYLNPIKTFAMADTFLNNNPVNGIKVISTGDYIPNHRVQYYNNGSIVKEEGISSGYNRDLTIEKDGNKFTLTGKNFLDEEIVSTYTYNFDLQLEEGQSLNNITSFTLRNNNNEDIATLDLSNFSFYIISDILDVNIISTLANINADINNTSPIITTTAYYAFGNETNNLSAFQQTDLGEDIGQDARFFQMALNFDTGGFSSAISLCSAENLTGQILSSVLVLQLVNLSGKSVLEALQDLALISGYEFGVDRQGIFFFRPRLQSTTPIFELDETQIVKIENIKQNFNDFFTKLTLTFAEIPLEFYANTGTRPTLVDKYGIVNKEINKPDIVNYDNPELAQAIGPQLLEIYSNLSNLIQCTAKLNLSLELGDIVNIKRNYNLNTPDAASDYEKFINQNTYYRACKITGINYNLAKKQMTYTLRDVSNSNTEPQQQTPQFVYTLPIEL